MHHPGRQRDNNTSASYDADVHLTGLCIHTFPSSPTNSHPTSFPRLDIPKWRQKRTNAGPTWVSLSDQAVACLRPRLTATSAVIPYQEPLSKGDNPELSSTLSQTLPMAAIFMRNRYIGWYVTSILRLHSMPRTRRHLGLDHRLRKEQPHTQWKLTLFDEYIGRLWFSASRTGWARAKIARRATAHRATSPSACRSCL